MRGLACVLILLLSGCAAPTDSTAPDVVVETPVAPTAYELVCPPGGSDLGDVCAYRIASLTETNQEPFVAVHPRDADIMAIGVNAGHTANGANLDGESLGFDMVRMDIFITTDGGRLWIRSTLPYVDDPDVTFEPVQSTVIGDPAMEFDEQGTLHVSGIASHSQLRGYNVFYTQSTDMGASWSRPQVLSTGDDNDRNWLNIGPDGTIYVPWQRVGTLSEIAWSMDGGHTWNIQQRSQVADGCITISEMAFFGDEVLFACTMRWDRTYEAHVHTFDPATGHIERIAETVLPCVWPKLNNAGGVLFLSGEGCPGNEFATSTDGLDWTAPRDLAKIHAGSVMWQTDDPWGRMHLLFADGGSKAYAVYDVKNRTTMQQVALPAEDPSDPPNSVAPPYGDHYWGIDVTETGGALVWTRGNSLDLSFLRPVIPDT